MQIEALEYFMELAEAGSFNRAAERLFISQQGLNKAISSLENELSVKLIERSHTGVELTSAGSALLKHARAIVGDYKAMVDEVTRKNDRRSRPDEEVSLLMTAYTSALLAGFPGVRPSLGNVIMSESSIGDIAKRASRATEDELFFIELYPQFEKVIGRYANLAFRTLIVSQTGIAWREGFPLAQESSIHRGDLVHVPLAYNSRHEMSTWLKWLFEETPLENVQLQTSSIRLLLEFAHGGCASLIDRYGYLVCCSDPAQPTDGLRFTPLSSPAARTKIGFLYRSDLRPGHRSLRVVENIRHMLENVENASMP